jgi:hypothetical protein
MLFKFLVTYNVPDADFVTKEDREGFVLDSTREIMHSSSHGDGGIDPESCELQSGFTVIGVYDDAKYDGGRFAEVFEAVTAEEAEDMAENWAQQQDGSPEIIICGVIEGQVAVVR